MRSWAVTLVALLALSSLWLIPPEPVRAQSPPDPKAIAEAKQLFRAGDRAYKEGQFDFAAQAFDKAYALAPRPALRFSAAQALRKLYSTERDVGALKKARQYLEQYLAEVPDGGRRLDATEALEEIEGLLRGAAPGAGVGGGDGAGGDAGSATPDPPGPKPGRMQIDANVKGAVATVEGHVRGKRLPAFLKLPAGSYQVAVEAAGYEKDTRTVLVQSGELALVTAKLEERPATVHIAGDEGADVVVDGRLMGRTPMARPLELDSGKHSIAIGYRGYDPLVESVDLRRAERHDIDVDLGLTTQRIVAWSFFAAGGAFIGAGITLSAVSISNQRDAQVILSKTTGERRAMRPAEAEAYNSAVSTRDNLNGFAGTAFTLGLISGGVGLLLFLLDDPDLYAASAEQMNASDKADEPAAPGPHRGEDAVELDGALSPSDRGGQVIVRGRF